MGDQGEELEHQPDTGEHCGEVDVGADSLPERALSAGNSDGIGAFELGALGQRSGHSPGEIGEIALGHCHAVAAPGFVEDVCALLHCSIA